MTTNLIDRAVAAKVLNRTEMRRDTDRSNGLSSITVRDAFASARAAAFHLGQAEALNAAAEVLEAATRDDVPVEVLLRALLDAATAPIAVEALAERHIEGRREAIQFVTGALSAFSS